MTLAECKRFEQETGLEPWFDVGTDELRPLQQKDVNLLKGLAMCYWKLRREIAATSSLEELRSKMNELESLRKSDPTGLTPQALGLMN